MPAPRVAVVDAYSTSRFLAPLFAQRGVECVHVQSSHRIPPLLAHTFHQHDFVANVVHDEDGGGLAATLEALSAHAPTAVLAGSEVGVELADRLSEAAGLRTNGTALSPARRDKFRMVETVRAAGLPVADQLLAEDADALLAWYRRRGGGRVVVKPVRSAGNDGVAFCDTEQEVRAAFGSIADTEAAMGYRNTAVIVQEYLLGVEYYVNTVSLDGRHHVTDVHSTQHVDVNGVRDLLAASQLLPRRGPEQDLLVPYVLAVLDALGIRNGPAHTEVKLTADGPRLVETASRICGADLPVLVSQAIGESQLEWTVDLHCDPQRFAARCGEDYRIERHATCVNMISAVSGTVRDIPGLARLRRLESFHDVLLKVRPGGRVERTVNDFTYPMLVHLLHPSAAVVRRDEATARWLDGPGFYDVEPVTTAVEEPVATAFGTPVAAAVAGLS